MNNANQFDSTVLSSLKSLGNQLRTEKFTLRAVVQKRKECQQQEKNVRARIKSLMHKISWEIDQNNQINKPKSEEKE